MSWDISIYKFPTAYSSVADIPEDSSLVPLGTRRSVQQAISKVFADTDWSDPAWGIWESSNGSIEFNLGESETNDGFMLHVRAGGEVVPLIVSLCIDNEWQGLDCSTGEFIERSSNPAQGLESWADYAAGIINPDKGRSTH